MEKGKQEGGGGKKTEKEKNKLDLSYWLQYCAPDVPTPEDVVQTGSEIVVLQAFDNCRTTYQRCTRSKITIRDADASCESNCRLIGLSISLFIHSARIVGPALQLLLSMSNMCSSRALATHCLPLLSLLNVQVYQMPPSATGIARAAAHNLVRQCGGLLFDETIQKKSELDRLLVWIKQTLDSPFCKDDVKTACHCLDKLCRKPDSTIGIGLLPVVKKLVAKKELDTTYSVLADEFVRRAETFAAKELPKLGQQPAKRKKESVEQHPTKEEQTDNTQHHADPQEAPPQKNKKEQQPQERKTESDDAVSSPLLQSTTYVSAASSSSYVSVVDLVNFLTEKNEQYDYEIEGIQDCISNELTQVQQLHQALREAEEELVMAKQEFAQRGRMCSRESSSGTRVDTNHTSGSASSRFGSSSPIEATPGVNKELNDLLQRERKLEADVKRQMVLIRQDEAYYEELVAHQSKSIALARRSFDERR